MKVTFKTIKQDTFSLEFETSTKVSDVKAAVEKEKGDALPADSMVLISQGKVLADDTDLASNNVTETGFLVVMIRGKPKPKPAAPSAARTPAAAATPSAPAAQPPTASTEQPAAAQTSAPAPASAEPAATAASTPGPDASAPTPAPAAAAPAAAGGDSGLATGSQLEQNIAQICEMGFPRDEVLRALRAAYNNPDRAVEYLMTGIPPSAEPPAPVARPPAPASQGQGGQQAASGAASDQAAPQGLDAPAFDMFAPQPAGGGQTGPLDFLRSNPQFQGLRQIVQSNPQILQPMLQELGKQNPQLFALITQNQGEFMRLLSEPANAAPANPQAADLAAQLAAAAGGGGGGQGAPVQITLTQEEVEVIGRLEAMGFDRTMCIEAFLACDKNEALAANFLLENAMDQGD